MPGEHKRSGVWKFFTKESPYESACNICDKVCKSSGNTTNLRNHLRSKHGNSYQALCSFAEDLDVVCATARMEWGERITEEIGESAVESKDKILTNEVQEGNEVNGKVEGKKKYKRKKSTTNEIPDPIKRLCVPEVSPIKTEMEHDLDIFGRSIAAQLKKLPENKAIRATMEINRLVGEARLSDIDEQLSKGNSVESPHVITVSYGDPVCSNQSESESNLEIMHEV